MPNLTTSAGFQNPLVVLFRQDTPGAASSDFVLTRSARVISASCASRANQAGATLTISMIRGEYIAPLTNAMDASAEYALIAALQLNHEVYDTQAGDRIRFTTTGDATLVDSSLIMCPPGCSLEPSTDNPKYSSGPLPPPPPDPGSDTLQQAYNRGSTIITAAGVPVVITGAAGLAVYGATGLTLGSSITTPEVASVNVVAGEVLRYTEGVKAVTKADASAAARATFQFSMYAIGTASASTAIGDLVPIATGPKATVLMDSVVNLSDTGKVVYLSPTVPGRGTLTVPSAPGDSIYKLGVVSVANGTNLITVLWMPNFVLVM